MAYEVAGSRSGAQRATAGSKLFTSLPDDVLLGILTNHGLSKRDLASLIATCRGLWCRPGEPRGAWGTVRAVLHSIVTCQLAWKSKQEEVGRRDPLEEAAMWMCQKSYSWQQLGRQRQARRLQLFGCWKRVLPHVIERENRGPIYFPPIKYLPGAPAYVLYNTSTTIEAGEDWELVRKRRWHSLQAVVSAWLRAARLRAPPASIDGGPPFSEADSEAGHWGRHWRRRRPRADAAIPVWRR